MDIRRGFVVDRSVPASRRKNEDTQKLLFAKPRIVASSRVELLCVVTVLNMRPRFIYFPTYHVFPPLTTPVKGIPSLWTRKLRTGISTPVLCPSG